MSLDNQNKLKNSERPRFQWWLLIAGFWVGVVVAVVIIGSRPQPVQNQNPPGNTEDIWMTATAVVQESTNTAAAAGFSAATPDPNAIPLTATAYILDATRLANQPQTPIPADIDSFALTATQIVREATQTAEGG